MKRKNLLSIIPLLLLCMPPASASPADPQISYLNEQVDIHRVSQSTTDEVSLTLTITSDLSPYEQVTYEFKSIEGTYLAVLTKRLVGAYEEMQELTLMTQESISGLLVDIDRCELPGSSEPEDVVPREALHNTTYAIEMVHSSHEGCTVNCDRSLRLTMDSSEIALNSPFWCVVSHLTSTYHRYGDPVLFQGGFFEEGEYGLVHLDSTPGSRIFLDGYDTGLDTPVYHLKVAPGLHRLRLVNSELSLEREYEITVEVGVLTRMVVDLY